jgi:hypothetical protein
MLAQNFKQKLSKKNEEPSVENGEVMALTLVAGEFSECWPGRQLPDGNERQGTRP